MSLMRQSENSSSVYLNVYDLTPQVNQYAYILGLGKVMIIPAPGKAATGRFTLTAPHAQESTMLEWLCMAMNLHLEAMSLMRPASSVQSLKTPP